MVVWSVGIFGEAGLDWFLFSLFFFPPRQLECGGVFWSESPNFPLVMQCYVSLVLVAMISCGITEEVLQSRECPFFPCSSLFLCDGFRFEPLFFPFIGGFSHSPLHCIQSLISSLFNFRTGVCALDSLCHTRIHQTAPGRNTATRYYWTTTGR